MLPNAWEHSLWYDIWPHTPLDYLWSTLITQPCIVIVSDAAVLPNGQAMCAWTIWAGQPIWSGEGYVPRNPDDIYSSLAEPIEFILLSSFSSNMSNYTH